MVGLIGKKLGMTQVYDEDGKVIPVTVVEAGPCPVLDVRKQDSHGYSAIQIGFGKKKAKNVSKAVLGHLAKSQNAENPPSVIKEIRWRECRAQNAYTCTRISEWCQFCARDDTCMAYSLLYRRPLLIPYF